MRRTVFAAACVLLLAATPASAVFWPTSPVTRQFGGAGNDEALGVSANLTVGVTGNPGDRDAFVRSIGVRGAKEWTVRIVTPGDDRAVGVAFGHRRIFVAGTTTGSVEPRSAGGMDVFVRAYRLDGHTVWTRQFGTPGDDVASAIGAGEAGGLSIVGWTDGDLAAPNAGGDDIFVRHLSRTGALEWSTQVGSAGKDHAACLDAHDPGFICGWTDGSLPAQSTAGGRDAFAALFDPTDGSVTWLRQFGTSADDAVTGIGSMGIGPSFLVGGTTGGQFAGATSAGGSDGFVANFQDPSDPVLDGVLQIGTPGEDTLDGLTASGGFATLAGTTDGAFPGKTSDGGTDAWAAVLDQPLYDDPPFGLVWIQQFGTSGDETVSGIAGELGFGIPSMWGDVVGSTTGAFPGSVDHGGRDAFWSLRFQPNDLLAQADLTRGLAAARAYETAHGGSYDGFDQANATTLNPSYAWLNAATDPHDPMELMIAEANGGTVRLWTYARSGTYFCIEEVGGVVGYGHALATDLDHCSGGW